MNAPEWPGLTAGKRRGQLFELIYAGFEFAADRQQRGHVIRAGGQVLTDFGRGGVPVGFWPHPDDQELVRAERLPGLRGELRW